MVVVAVTMVIVSVVIMVCVWVLVIALFAVENQEIQAERIESRDKHAGQHRKISKPSARQMAGRKNGSRPSATEGVLHHILGDYTS